MRLGELLIADGLVLPAHVARALGIQRRTRRRLGSLLVDAGLATADAVARALGRMHGVPAALERHLAGNDASLTALVSPELARSKMVLPLARTRDGKVVIAMRDPADAGTRAALAASIGAPVIAAAACELVLERHVARVYATDLDEIEVDLETGPPPTMELELPDLDLGPPTDILDPQTVRAAPAQLAADFLDPETIRFGALVSLDDVGVTRDPRQSDPGMATGRQSGSFGAVTPALGTPRPTPAPGAVASVSTLPPATSKPSARVELTATLARIATAASRDAITAAAVDHGRGGVDTLVVLAVRQGMAIGDAGFGPGLTAAAIQAVTLPLTQPSVIKTAVDTARPYAGRPPVGGGVQDRVLALLGKPGGIVVAPITSGGRVVSLLVAAVGSQAAADAIASELVTIAGACGVAYARIR